MPEQSSAAQPALARAEECLTALLGATRVCVKADRVEKQIATDEVAAAGHRKSKRVPTGDFVLTLFEGGSIVCATKQEAQALAEALTKALQGVLRPVQQTLIGVVRTTIAMKANLPDDKRAVMEIQAARSLGNFRYNAVEKQAGYVVVPESNAIAYLPGDDRLMDQIHTSVNTALKKVMSPICDKLRVACDKALAEALDK